MKILLIEDNPDHVELIEEACNQAFSHDVIMDIVKTLSEGKVGIETKNHDIALIDLKLPDSPISDTVEYLSELKTQLPIVVLTSLDDGKVGEGLVHMGVQDYLPKNDLNPTLLQRICTYAIERKKQQAALEAMALDQQVFCSSLSHDFKAPIRNIGIFSKMLQQKISARIELTSEDKEMFGIIGEKILIVHDLIENLHRYMLAEFSVDEFELVDLNLLITDISTLLESAESDSINVSFENLPKIFGSRSQLFLLFQNVIQNAIKYNDNTPVIEIESLVNSESTIVIVKDNGIGIDPKFFDKIFKPFQRLHPQRKYGGSGLGLSIVKRILDRHMGSVSIQSSPGGGSVFTFAFPVGPQSPPSA